MDKIAQIQAVLQKSVSISKEKAATFFKTNAGGYAETDQFIGVTVPTLRQIAKEFSSLSLEELGCLMESKINEERLLALLILVDQYQKKPIDVQEKLYQFYLDNLGYVNNWNLVDSSAHHIIGAHLWKRDRDKLLFLARSEVLWERRISIVSTWYFIRKKDVDWTFKIAEILLKDDQDLIHKAAGWMLREAGKQELQKLLSFLDQNAKKMPRTMLRYAIEKFPEELRKSYLIKK